MRIVAACAPFVVLLVWASLAQAVSTDYCNTSLHGGGTLAPDNDIYRRWQYLESSMGVDITSSYAMKWYPSETWTYMEARWVFWRRNGQAIYDWFYCNDLRPYNGQYGDDHGRL